MESVDKIHKCSQCTQCEYKATQRGNLHIHIKSVHEGQKFPCPQCEFKATFKGSLQTHIKSLHEGKKVECTQCEYKAKNKTLLQKHMKSVHGKVISEVKIKTEDLCDNVDIAIGEYFETDVKSEDNFDV